MSGIVRKQLAGVRRRAWMAVGTALVTAAAMLGAPVLAQAQSTSPPRTGQTVCTDTAGVRIACLLTGQDGEYKAGVHWPLLRFTDNLDGTITDGLTGLMWIGDGNLMATQNPAFDLDGTPGDGAVFWQTALNYVADLNLIAYLGYTDWRLPNRKELIYLLTMNNPLVSYPFANRHLDQWTSSTDAALATSAWAGYQSNLIAIQPADKATQTLHVWPVRSTGVPGVVVVPVTGQQTCYNKNGAVISCGNSGQDGATKTGATGPSPRYLDQSNGTVNDAFSGLSWTKDTNLMLTRDPVFDTVGLVDGLVTWQMALNYVALLNQQAYLGNVDWRLPNYIELDSLVDAELSSPSLSGGSPFTNVAAGNGQRWSSTSAAGYLGAWSMDHNTGSMVGALKTGVAAVWPVRGGILTPNTLPVLSPVTPPVADEGTQLDVPLLASDADNDIVTFASPDLPVQCGILNMGNNSALLSCAWDYLSAGAYPMTIVVDDSNGGVATQAVTITVNNVNQPPVLAPIGARNTAEGAPYTLTITASDGDADPLTLTALNVPAPLCTFTDNGDTTATLTCSPGYTDAGVYPMTVTVTDPGLLAASETFSLTVNDTNRPPVLDPVAAQTSDEGMLLEVPLTASDPDQNTLVFGGSNLPASCSVSGTGVNTGLLSCQWTFQDAGVHTVTLSVNDGLGGVASQTATLTVNNVNAPPVLAPIATQRPREAFPYGITVLASDVDGEIATIASLVLPTQCTLTDKGDNSADLACSFVLGEAGSYPVSISATDPQGATSQVDFLMSVGVQNRAPVFNPTAAQTGREGQSHSFTVSATDADGDPLNFRSTLSQCATASTGAQSARVTCTWSYYDAGTQTVPLVVTDAYGGAANQNVAVTVANVNGAPAINPVSYQSTKEGIAYTLALSATDPDGDAFTFSVKFIPGSCGLTNNLNGTATLDCNWGYDDSGNYKVTVSAKDTLGNSSSLDITLAVANVNRVPVLDPIGPRSGAEMALVEVPVLAADPDGERIAHYFAGLPRGMKFDGTRKVLYWTPGDRDAGTYDITVTVTDYKGQAAETFRLTIANTNVAPTLSGLPATLTASELSTVTYSLAGTDRDGDPVQVTGSGLPAFCSLTGGGTANATLSCTPGGGTVGTYSGIVLSVSDGLLATTYTPVLTVGPINTAPALAVIAAQTVSEGGALAVAVSGSDPDGDAVTLVAGAMPGFCTFTGAGGSGSVGCNPGFADAGSYSATVSVTDGFLWDTRTFAITVNDVNRVPVLSPIGNQIITETLNLNVSILGSDPDGQAVSFSATGFPGFCTFGDNLNGTATMACSPAKGTAGMYGPIDVVASDGQMVASESITLEVLDPNLIDDVCDGVDNNLNGVVDEGFPAGNTTCGQQVPIRNDVVVVTFDKVAVSGDTNVIRNQPAPALPPGVRKANGTDTYEISATVGFTQAEVCIGYIGALVGSESGLGLYHYAGGVWNNITSNVDKLNDRVCGTTTSFSPFIVGVDIPILVNLDTFSATSDGSSVKLSWVTTAEIDNEGFNVLRSEALAGPYETVNGYLIPARGMGIGGAGYSFTDTTAVPGATYHYLLEDVENTGLRTPHGPLVISVVDGASALYTEPDPLTSTKDVPDSRGSRFGGGCSVSEAPTSWGDAAGTLLLFLPLMAWMIRRRVRHSGRGTG